MSHAESLAATEAANPMPYPEQSPAALRAQAVSEQFEKVRKALNRYSLIYSRYAAGQTDYKTVCDARYSLDRTLNYVEGVVFDALTEAGVQVIHDRPGGES